MLLLCTYIKIIIIFIHTTHTPTYMHAPVWVKIVEFFTNTQYYNNVQTATTGHRTTFKIRHWQAPALYLLPRKKNRPSPSHEFNSQVNIIGSNNNDAVWSGVMAGVNRSIIIWFVNIIIIVRINSFVVIIVFADIFIAYRVVRTLSVFLIFFF